MKKGTFIVLFLSLHGPHCWDLPVLFSKLSFLHLVYVSFFNPEQCSQNIFLKYLFNFYHSPTKPKMGSLSLSLESTLDQLLKVSLIPVYTGNCIFWFSLTHSVFFSHCNLPSGAAQTLCWGHFYFSIFVYYPFPPWNVLQKIIIFSISWSILTSYFYSKCCL